MSEVVHQCPPDGSNIMPCCGRTPYEVPPSDGIALRRYETLGGVKPNCQGEQVSDYPPATELVFERDFTVNTETVRKVYRYVRTDATEFDRWLAEVKADAWEEGVADRDRYDYPENPYREGETDD